MSLSERSQGSYLDAYIFPELLRLLGKKAITSNSYEKKFRNPI